MPRPTKLRLSALFLASALVPPALFAADPETLFAQTLASGSLTLAFEERAVVVAGLEPGAELAWFSLTYEHDGYDDLLLRREGIAEDADADGAVRLEVERGVWTKSIWAAVDLDTGGYAVAVPPYSPLEPSAFPLHGLAAGARGQLNRFQDRREAVEVFYVRRGLGAWRLAVRDGGGRDADGAEDGSLAAPLDQAEPIGPSPPAPELLLPGDFLVVIDPRTFEYFAIQVPGNLPGLP